MHRNDCHNHEYYPCSSESRKCPYCIIGSKQTQIDELMLEYCPHRMTQDQLIEWGLNQKLVEVKNE
jgi:hypothetical protein